MALDRFRRWCPRALLLVMTSSVGCAERTRLPGALPPGPRPTGSCAQSAIGDWEFASFAPARRPNDVLAMVLKSYEQIRISPHDWALVSPRDVTPIATYEVSQDSITQARLMLTVEGSSEPVTVQCPDGDHLVLVGFPVPGLFAYRRRVSDGGPT